MEFLSWFRMVNRRHYTPGLELEPQQVAGIAAAVVGTAAAVADIVVEVVDIEAVVRTSYTKR